MNKKKYHILSLILVFFLLVQSFACKSLQIISYAQTGTVITDCLNLRTGPGTGYSSAGTLSTNAKVTILSTVKGSDGYTWYQVSSPIGSGYLRSDFVNLQVTYNSADTDFEKYLTQQGFPESYKNSLRGLHQKYPNWVFTAQHTGLDWNTVISEESVIGRNLVYTDSISSWKSTEEGAFDWAANYWPGFDGSVWVAASTDVIEHYMDPRNFLTDPYIFQFQVQSYDPAVQTREGLEQMVQGTFLAGEIGGSSSNVSNTEAYGPGYAGNSTSGGSSAGNGPSSSGNTENGIEFSGPVASANQSIADSLFHLLGGITAEANWQKQQSGWVYVNDSGALNVNGWFWLDGNNDGVSECYYFDENGIMAADTKIGDYFVNSDGQWVVNGTVQTKQASSATSSSGKTTYVDLLMEAAKQSGVSPYVLAAMIIQEQGKQGTSPLISGTHSSYYGIYNFYNIGAYEHDGMSAVEAGLKYASESGTALRPWNSVEKGIIGGAIAYGANYTDQGQDTFYLKKFNVQGSNKYHHQYMTNVVAAAQEGAKISDAYSTQIKNSALTFKIPVYENMPESSCEIPTKKGSPNNKLNTLQADGFALTPTFHMNTADYSLIVDSSVSSINITAVPIDSRSTISGAGNRQLGEGLNTIAVTVTAENGDMRTYTLNITRKPGGSTSSSAGPGASTSSAGPGVSTSSAGPGSTSTSGGNSSTGFGPASTGQNMSGTAGSPVNNSSSNAGGSSNTDTESNVELCGPPS